MIENAHALPGGTSDLDAPPPGGEHAIVPWIRELSRAAKGGGRGPQGDEDIGGLRRRVHVVLAHLARRAEPALSETLERARRAWDQADDLVVIDDDTEAEIAATRRLLARTIAAGAPGAAAVALEGLLALDAAYVLVRLFEHRLAALLRLRLRSTDAELLPEGRPFLDLAAALAEAAEAWR